MYSTLNAELRRELGHAQADLGYVASIRLAMTFALDLLAELPVGAIGQHAARDLDGATRAARACATADFDRRLRDVAERAARPLLDPAHPARHLFAVVNVNDPKGAAHAALRLAQLSGATDRARLVLGELRSRDLGIRFPVPTRSIAIRRRAPPVI